MFHCLQGNGLNNELKDGSFFIKSLPTSNEEKRRILTQWGIFRKEVMIFEHLIPKLVKHSCKWKSVLRVSVVLVLEDD